jgi:hypothetical protein
MDNDWVEVNLPWDISEEIYSTLIPYKFVEDLEEFKKEFDEKFKKHLENKSFDLYENMLHEKEMNDFIFNHPLNEIVDKENKINIASNLEIKKKHAFKYSAHVGMLIAFEEQGEVFKRLLGDFCLIMEMGVAQNYPKPDTKVLRYKVVYIPDKIEYFDENIYKY